MKASVIFNPQAGSRTVLARVKDAGAYLSDQGWRITWLETTAAGHATELARQSAEHGDDVAIAVGGDGTINEVINGLVGSKTALGILPTGTANVFAADMRIPTPSPLAPGALARAAERLFSGQTRTVDVARATFQDKTSRYFLLWAGIGIDAAISTAVEADQHRYPERRALGLLAWVLSGLYVIRRFRGKRMVIKMDDLTIERRAILTTVNNARRYARLWQLSPQALLDDGLLDVVIMEGYGLHSSLKHALLALLGRHVDDPEVHIHRTSRVSIETQEPVPVHLDAENVGHTPVEIEVAPQALKIIIPQDAPRDHFVVRTEAP